ncbi:MAG: DUF2298 domain-containing protein [Burkholderiales bacterium]
MYFILLSLNIFLILINLAGLATMVMRWVPHYALAKAIGALFFCLGLFFLEHFFGLGKLTWLWPITTGVSLYLILRQKQNWKKFYAAEWVFALGFLYALMWRGAFPDIYPSSERVTDLYFITNYLPGVTLPPLDYWLPPQKFNFYYSFQHYAAALMARIFGLDGGTAYNLGFCVLTALAISCAWFFISHYCRKPAAKILLLLTFVIGGTGVSPFVHFLIDEQQFGRRADLWASMRFAGSYDVFLNTPLANTLFPKPTGLPAGFEPRDLPTENFSYLIYLGDYHPPLGSYFLLMLTLALFAAMEPKASKNTAPNALTIKSQGLMPAALGVTLPAMMITNTWIFPLQGLLLLLWGAYRYRTKIPTDWMAGFAGVVGGFLLIFPFLVDFAAHAQSTPIRWVEWQDHTRLLQFIALHWPLMLLFALACAQKETRQLGFCLALALGLMLFLSEFIYVDDPSGGKFIRTNTTMKWWGWIFALGVVGVGTYTIAAKNKIIQYATVAILLLLCTYGFDLGRDWFLTGKQSAGKLHGHEWLTRDGTLRDMIRFLRVAPDGIVLESSDRGSYGNSTTVALFSAKPSMQGWADHVVTWRGPSLHARAQQEEQRKFYAGEKADALGWLQQNRVRYIIWGGSDQSKKPDARDSIQSQIGSHYQWKSFYEAANTKVGMWILK